MKNTFSKGFVNQTDDSFKEHYLKYIDYCRTTVQQTIDKWSSKENLKVLCGVDDPEYLSLLKQTWHDPLRSYTRRSGKHIRPYLVCFCLEAYGQKPEEWPEAVALSEIIHSSSLILDDIVDDSHFRRGAPTVHRSIGQLVAGASASSWLNIARYLFLHEENRLGEEAVNQLLDELCWEHYVTGVGTTVDLTWAWLREGKFSEAAYMQQVQHRSTSYTYRMPLRIGGICAKAPKSDYDILVKYGEYVGLGFQLIDDILNAVSDDTHWGKEMREDIIQGKYTLQVIKTLERSSEATRKRLIAILDSRTHDQKLLLEAMHIIKDSGAMDYCSDLAIDYMEKAKEVVTHLSVDQEYISILQRFANYIVERTR